MVTEKLRRAVPVLFSALLGTTTLVALGVFVGGCENPTAQADKKVRQGVETAESHATKPQDRKNLMAALGTLAKVPNASPATKVEVTLEEARLETDAADDLARKAGSDEIDLARLAGQVQALTGQIAANNLLIDGLGKREPAEALKGVDDAIAAAKGTGDTATWGSPDKGVPAGSAVDAETARINADIQKLTSERTTLDTQQKQNTDEARQLEEQAAKTHGKDARDAGLKAAGLRRDARTANMRMEQIDRAVASLQDQLKVEDARKSALAQADKAYQDRKAQIAAGWEEIKKQIDVYQDQSKKLLEGNGDAREQPLTAPSAASTGSPASSPPASAGSAPGKAPQQAKTYDAANPPTPEELAAAMRDANVTRLGLLIQAELGKYDADRKAAIEKYESAYNDLKQAQPWASQTPKLFSEKEAIKGLADLYSPNDFKLRLAGIRLKEAQVHAEQADTVSVLDEARSKLSAALEQAKLQMPAEFSNLPPGSTVADLRKQSDDEYTDADTTLEEVAQATTGIGRSAREMQVVERYARAKDAARADDTAKAETQLTTAKNILQALNTDNPLPDSLYLTPELAAAIRTAPKLPATTAPATSGGIFTPGGTTAAVPNDWVVHSVGTGGITVKAPPSWEEAPVPPTPPGLLIMLKSSEQPGASVGLGSVPPGTFPPGVTVEAFLAVAPNVLKALYPDLHVLSSQVLNVGANKAGKVVFDTSKDGKKAQIAEYIFMRPDTAYVLVTGAPSETYASLDPMFQQVAGTLQFPGAPAAPAPAAASSTPAIPATPDATAAPATAPTTPDTSTPATPATSPAP